MGHFCFRLSVVEIMTVLFLFFLHLVASKPGIGLLVASEPGIGLLVGGYGNSGQLSSTETLGLSSCELPSLPSPLKRHLTILTKDDQVLVCGGKGVAGQYFTSCLNLQPQDQSWKPHSNMLKNREYSSAVSLASGVLVLGGSGSARYTTEFLATGSTTWVAGSQVPGAGIEDGCSVDIGGDKLLAIGGYWENNQVVEYNVLSGVWTQWPELPEGRYGHKCGRVEETVVIVGGADQRGDYVPSTILLNLVTRQVTKGGDMSMPRFEHGVAFVGNELLVFGGFDTAYNCLAEVEAWNPETETWKLVNMELKTGRAEFGTVAVHSNFIICSSA